MTVDARAPASFEELTNLFNARSSNLSLSDLLADPEGQLHDFPFLHKLPQQQQPHLALPPDVTESSAAATTVVPAAAEPGPSAGIPRVTSLDFIRAFLTARQGGAGGGEVAGGEAGCISQQFPCCSLAVKGTNTEQQAAGAMMGAQADPAGSSVTATAQAVPPTSAPTSAAAAAAADVSLGAMPALPGFGALLAPPPVPAVPTPGMPPAVLAAFMHSAPAGASHSMGMSGLASVPLLPIPLPLPVAPLVPANGCGRDPGMLPSLPTSATAGGGCEDSGRGGSSSCGEPAAHAVHAVNTAGMCKAEIRRVRRMVSNRESARRSRKRKQEALSDADQKVQEAQAQLADANAKVARLTDKLAKRDCELTMLRLEVEALRSRQ